MNKAYFDETIKKLEFPISSIEDINKSFNILLSKEKEVDSVINIYDNDMYTDFDSLIDKITDISREAGLHEYKGHLVFLVLLSEKLKENYKKYNLSMDVFYDTMKDLKWKLLECECIYKMEGIFVAKWYEAFYRMYRFTLGRLQFEINRFNNNYEKDGVTITEADPILSIHIPRTLERLDEASINDAFKKAEVFFDKILRKDVIPFTCYSWILHPGNDTVFNEGTNLYKFKNMFDLIDYGDHEDYEELWRIFDEEIDVNHLENLKSDTSIRRNFIEKIKRGEKIGFGFGIHIYKRSK